MSLSCSGSFCPQRNSPATSSTAVRPPCFGSHCTHSLWFSWAVSPAPPPALWPVPSRGGPSAGLPASSPRHSCPPCPGPGHSSRSRDRAASGPGPLLPCWCFWNSFPLPSLCSTGRGSRHWHAVRPGMPLGGSWVGSSEGPDPWPRPAPLPPCFTPGWRLPWTCHEMRRWLFKETSLFI